MQTRTSQFLNELFLSETRSNKNIPLLAALYPIYLYALLQLEFSSIMNPEKAICLESRMIYAFTKAFTSHCTDEEMIKYLQHNFLKTGGYFYELTSSFHIIFLCDGITPNAFRWAKEHIKSESN